MKRIQIQPRDNWENLLEESGFLYHTANGEPYWNESAVYEFTLNEINRIEKATNDLQVLVIGAVEHIIDNNRFSDLGIGDYAKDLILKSWNNEKFDEISLLGRFDLAYDGNNLKLLEYNADTPTSLPEAALIQWNWLKDVFPQYDQFNSIHDKLIDRWKDLALHFQNKQVFLSCLHDSEEDYGNVMYLADTAAQAGLEPEFVYIQDIAYNHQFNKFYSGNQQIDTLFKLYPWEWMVKDKFGQFVDKLRIVEPAWKMLLSNKAILPILWELNPDHPNLLESYFLNNCKFTTRDSYVIKPFLSREGANISITENGQEIAYSLGSYGDNPVIYQQYFQLPKFNDNYPIIGSWVIGENAAGMGIREDNGLITGNLSRFVPHYIKD